MVGFQEAGLATAGIRFVERCLFAYTIGVYVSCDGVQGQSVVNDDMCSLAIVLRALISVKVGCI